MFKEEETQYCPMCEEWAEKHDQLKAEIEILEKDKANLEVIKETLKVQFNQLKAECEEWKNKYYSSTTEVKADLIKQVDELREENKDLREDIKDIANLLDLDIGEEYNFGNIEAEIRRLKEELELNTANAVVIDMAKRLHKYKQALQEILDEARDGYCSGTQTGCEKSLQLILKICEVIKNEI